MSNEFGFTVVEDDSVPEGQVRFINAVPLREIVEMHKSDCPIYTVVSQAVTPTSDSVVFSAVRCVGGCRRA